MKPTWKGRRPVQTYRGAKRNVMRHEKHKVERYIRKERWASYKLWER